MHRRSILTTFTIVIGLLVISAASIVDRRDNQQESLEEMVYLPSTYKAMAELESPDFKQAIQSRSRSDHITEYYMDPRTQPLVLEFFAAITSSREISEIILDAATDRNLPPALVFALVHEESRFNPRAINRNSQTVDRGLFQLNSASFPKLGVEDFYDPRTNARYGTAHLAYCLEQAGNEVAALAVYNAGYGRVTKTGTPRSTLDYIHRALNYRSNLEALFEAQVVAKDAQSVRLASIKGFDQQSSH
ncbi:MAG: lytic transglycosylase domain-containing protein [Clostridia bacterium]|jgi:soluble lytic murein transglycosylase-like protein|nr:lytic transglycosylase domain-containing protein [Spirochaetia bacterium]